MCAASEQRHHSDSRHELRVLFLAIEEAHKADIRAYSSGHLNPYWLSQRDNIRKMKDPIWRGAVNPRDRCDLLPQRSQTEARVERTKNTLFKGTDSTAEATAHSPYSEAAEKTPRPFLDPTELFLLKPSTARQTESTVTRGDPDRYWFTRSYMAGLTRKDQLQMRLEFAHSILKTQDLKEKKCLSRSKAIEQYERRLEQGLRKLPVENWPSRERLRIFSNTFDDICNGSQVFGDILRQIKMEYDLYLNSVLDSQSGLQNMVRSSSFTLYKDSCRFHTHTPALRSRSSYIQSNTFFPFYFITESPSALLKAEFLTFFLLCVKALPLRGQWSGVVGEGDLEKAWIKVWKLEREARRALEENDQVRLELRRERDHGPEGKGLREEAVLPGLNQGAGPASLIDWVQLKKCQVWNMLEEVRLLEKTIKEEMVSTVTTSTMEECIRDSEAEIVTLSASSARLCDVNKNLENSISKLLSRAKTSNEERVEFWEKIWYTMKQEDGDNS
ncbi:uncharacterized protein LOC118790351 [Megalops cyprinoides]|uniref:uncharacterized protein LOC118790351 n=1 Tax=Megalops cyprinoides TaxID=118141 RepID=UPI001864CDE4|nr:uncharacterized protein LOC118790351 [Megalops cyprinoides]